MSPRLLMACLLLALPFLIHFPAALADGEDVAALQPPQTRQWQLIKDDKPRNIQIYTKREDHERVRSMKAEAEIPASVKDMVGLLLDYERYPQWFWRLKEIRPLKVVSPMEAYVYVVFSPPMGFPDRDVVLHFTAEYLHNGQRAVVQANSVNDYYPEQPGRVRMPYARMDSKINEIAEGRIYFKGEVIMDPGGKLPVWASNFVQRQGPYLTMLNVLKVLERPQTDQQALNGREPPHSRSGVRQ
ncbi:MAG TPA: hypothetical protein VFW42_01485 [Fluviicoccus sp.]|nr:hypothetical protein [Fluviicoccus sp.]